MPNRCHKKSSIMGNCHDTWIFDVQPFLKQKNHLVESYKLMK